MRRNSNRQPQIDRTKHPQAPGAGGHTPGFGPSGKKLPPRPASFPEPPKDETPEESAE